MHAHICTLSLTPFRRAFNLEELTLSYNNLSGPVPPQLGQLKKLQAINLAGVQFVCSFVKLYCNLWTYPATGCCNSQAAQPPATTRNHPQPPATTRNHPQPPATTTEPCSIRWCSRSSPMNAGQRLWLYVLHTQTNRVVHCIILDSGCLPLTINPNRQPKAELCSSAQTSACQHKQWSSPATL
jgi:hypothetical protein